MTFDFKLGTPFKPYEQLMGVLPVASMEHIPQAYRVGPCILILAILSTDMTETGFDV